MLSSAQGELTDKEKPGVSEIIKIRFRGGSGAKIQTFLVLSTCFLYLVAAGLFSRAFWCFETQQWNKVIDGDAAELGDGPGSYDIDRSVWHLNVRSRFLGVRACAYFYVFH